VAFAIANTVFISLVCDGAASSRHADLIDLMRYSETRIQSMRAHFQFQDVKSCNFSCRRCFSRGHIIGICLGAVTWPTHSLSPAANTADTILVARELGSPVWVSGAQQVVDWPSDPHVARGRTLAAFIASVENSARVDQQQLDFARRIRFLLHSLWYDEHVARRELYCSVAKVEAEHSFEDDGRLVGLFVVVPDENRPVS
jgi:hypothetical protein